MALEFASSINGKKVPARKGKGWIKKTYKNLLFNECKCGDVIIHPLKKCPACVERERLEAEEEKKWCDCNKCGKRFRRGEEDPNGRTCDDCKEKFKYKQAHLAILAFFSGKNSLRKLPKERAIDEYSGVVRNTIQDITGFPHFRVKNMYFENIPLDLKDSEYCWDHNNSMKSSIKHYLTLCSNKRRYRKYKYFKQLLIQYYGVQLRSTSEINRDLVPLQKEGITPEKYLSVVGNVIIKEKNGTFTRKSREESIEILKPIFVYQDE
jgi:hypothetical protein